ncbi:LOW QUALITY PROTEIN: hypothetical protein HZS_4210 [Henneguya salminicola]|nr:LOW QUALITY PROTEIN: hypothetical protein HZS_4210 [Henneguya salminicola]
MKGLKNVPKPSNAQRACAKNIMEPIIKKNCFTTVTLTLIAVRTRERSITNAYLSSACKCRLIVCGQINVIKGAHICSVDIIAAINSQVHEISPVEFSTNFISEKAIQLELYPNQIYKLLSLKLRELYGSAPYPFLENLQSIGIFANREVLFSQIQYKRRLFRL